MTAVPSALFKKETTIRVWDRPGMTGQWLLSVKSCESTNPKTRKES